MIDHEGEKMTIWRAYTATRRDMKLSAYISIHAIIL